MSLRISPHRILPRRNDYRSTKRSWVKAAMEGGNHDQALQNMLLTNMMRRYAVASEDIISYIQAKVAAKKYGDQQDNAFAQAFVGGAFGFPATLLEDTDAKFPQWMHDEGNRQIDGVIWAQAACRRCEHCEERFLRSVSDFNRVIVSGRPSRYVFEEWCESCSYDEAFLCQSSQCLYDSEQFECTTTHEGDNICTLELTRSEYRYNSSLDEWIHCDHRRAYEGEEDSDDGDDYDNDDERSGGIPQYHCASRQWTDSHSPIFITPLDRTYGIELEVEFPSSSKRLTWFQQMCDRDGRSSDRKFTCELDGSLDDEQGLEVIGVPMPLRDYYGAKAPWRLMCQSLIDAGARAWPVRHSYGMHVNIDWRFERAPSVWDMDYVQTRELNESIDRFEAFMVNNRPLCSLVAGRNAAYNTGEHGGYVKALNMRELKQQDRADKYCLVRRRNTTSLVEIRIFGSNLRVEGIIRNIEFVDSLRIYADRPNANLFAGAGSADYRRWLLEPMNAARWSYIADYLRPSPKMIKDKPSPTVIQRLAVA